MIPEKLNFVEQKNTKNTTIAQKSVENSQNFDKNGQFSSEIPLALQRILREISGNRHLPTIPSKRKSVGVENVTTPVSHYRNEYGKCYAQFAVAYTAGKTID